MVRPGLKGDSVKRKLFDLFFVLFLMAAMGLGLVGCATVAPGEDPVLVHAQQTLSGATPIYGAAMKFYFANAATLSPQLTAAFEKIRTGYGPAYKALDDAVDAYKAGKKPDLAGLEAALSQLIADASTLVNVLKPVAPKPTSFFLPTIELPLRFAFAGGF
jgi:hypothetical protein